MADLDSKNTEITGRSTNLYGEWSITFQLQRLAIWGPIISTFLGPWRSN